MRTPSENDYEEAIKALRSRKEFTYIIIRAFLRAGKTLNKEEPIKIFGGEVFDECQNKKKDWTKVRSSPLAKVLQEKDPQERKKALEAYVDSLKD